MRQQVDRTLLTAMVVEVKVISFTMESRVGLKPFLGVVEKALGGREAKTVSSAPKFL